MGLRPILPIKVPVTISTMLNFNRPNFEPNIGDVACEQAVTIIFQDRHNVKVGVT